MRFDSVGFSLSFSLSCFRHFIGLFFKQNIEIESYLVVRNWVMYVIRFEIQEISQNKEPFSLGKRFRHLDYDWKLNGRRLWLILICGFWFARHKLVYFIEFNHFSLGAHNMKAPYGLRFWPLIIMWSGLWFSIFTIHEYERIWEMVNYLIHFRYMPTSKWKPVRIIRNDVCVANSHFKMITLYILHFDAVHCSSFIVYNAWCEIAFYSNVFRYTFKTSFVIWDEFTVLCEIAHATNQRIQCNAQIAMHSHLHIPQKRMTKCNQQKRNLGESHQIQVNQSIIICSKPCHDVHRRYCRYHSTTFLIGAVNRWQR